GLRRGARLVGVVVDVAGGDDDVLERRPPDAQARAVGLAVAPGGVDALDGRARVRRERAGELVARRLDPGVGLAAVGQRLGGLLRAYGPAREARPGQRGDAAPELAGRAGALDAGVDERHAVGIGALDAVGAQHGALDGDGGVAVDERLHVAGDVG